MKKLTAILSATIISISAAFSQAVDVRDFKDFNKVSASNTVEVIIKQQDTFSVQVEGPQHKIESIITELNGGTLKIHMKGSWKGKEEAKVLVGAPIFEKITTSGASTVKSTGLIEGENLHLTANGASNLYLSVKTTDLKINASGASEFILTGYTENIEVDASGASNVKAQQLDVINADINLSGASEAQLSVTESIDGTVSGAADLDLSGNPQKQSLNRTGGASINGVDWNNNYEEDVEIKNDIVGDVIVQEKGDTTRISVGKKKILIIDDWDKTKVDLDLKDSVQEPWYYGIDGIFYGINGFLNSNSQLNVPASHDFLETDVAKSASLQMYFFDPDIQLYERYITLHPSIGININEYEFRKNYWIDESNASNTEINGDLALNKDNQEIEFKKNRLTVDYVTAPLMIAFHTNKDHKKAFHFGLGGYGGIRIGSTMRYKYKEGRKNKRLKVKDDFYLNPFQYGLMASVGYSNINIFANYALNGMFENGKGPQLHPFSVGLRIVGF